MEHSAVRMCPYHIRYRVLAATGALPCMLPCLSMGGSHLSAYGADEWYVLAALGCLDHARMHGCVRHPASALTSCHTPAS